MFLTNFFRLRCFFLRLDRFKTELKQLQRRQDFEPLDTPCFSFTLVPRPFEYLHQLLILKPQLLLRFPLNLLLAISDDALKSSYGFICSIQKFVIVDKTSGSSASNSFSLASTLSILFHGLNLDLTEPTNDEAHYQ